MRHSTVGSEAVGVAGGDAGGSGGGPGGVSDVLTIKTSVASTRPSTPRAAVPATIPDVSTPPGASSDPPPTPLGCGCLVSTGRDFLGRVVGTVVTHGASCPRDDHQPGHVVLMPGREHARPE